MLYQRNKHFDLKKHFFYSKMICFFLQLIWMIDESDFVGEVFTELP